jgi:hypothetical protein
LAASFRSRSIRCSQLNDKEIGQFLGLVRDDERAAAIDALDDNGDGAVSFPEVVQKYGHLETNAELATSLKSLWLAGAGVAIEDSLGREVYTREALIAGAVAGLCARLVTAPLDRVRLLQQTRPAVGRGLGVDDFLRTCRSVYAREGFSGFWRGNVANMAKVIPLSAITCAVYTQSLGAMGISSPDDRPFLRFCAGAVSGVCATTCTFPLDVIRTRLAAQLPPSLDAPPHPSTLHSPYGAASPLAGHRPIQTLMPRDTSVRKEAFHPPGTALTHSVSGGPARRSSFGTRGSAPYKRIVPLTASSSRSLSSKAAQTFYTGTVHAAVSIAREEGLAGFFKGIRPTVASVTLFAGLQLAGYDILLPRLSGWLDQHMAPPAKQRPALWHSVIAGGLVGTIAQTLVFPLDTVRRQVQVQRESWVHPMTVVRSLARAEGFRGFYRGLLAANLKVAPAVAVTLSVRDSVLGRLSWR